MLPEILDLADAANRVSRTYSAGMRRRLNVAASLVARPAVVFLDEPTTGLDPRSRIGLWQLLPTLDDPDGTALRRLGLDPAGWEAALYRLYATKRGEYPRSLAVRECAT